MIKIEYQKQGIAIKGLSVDEFKVLKQIIEGVDEQCFKERQDFYFFSGNDYNDRLNKYERKALSSLSEGIKTAYNRL